MGESAPKFSSVAFSFTQEASISKEYSSDELLMSLNPDQKRAVERAVAAEDYLCILGMPGTGICNVHFLTLNLTGISEIISLIISQLISNSINNFNIF